MIFDFIDGAAGEESGSRLNCAAIAQVRLQPRVFVDVSQRSLRKTFLGQDFGLPFGIAPMGQCDLAWPGADRMLAAEALRREIPLGLSTAASTSLEEIQRLAPGRAWFQLYVTDGQEAALALAERAAEAGYEFLLLTVDTPEVSRRLRDRRNGFRSPFRFGPRQILDLARHPRWSLETLIRGVPKLRNIEMGQEEAGYLPTRGRNSVEWDFLDKLRACWKGKLIVKGVMTTADAAQVKDAGADGIYVSNHGARQLDSTPAAIELLPLIRETVGPDYPLVFDSGLRSGEDIVKALALGADFCMLGRAMLYAVGADGARGLSALVGNLAEEIDLTLAQIGLKSVEDIDGSVLYTGPDERRNWA